MQSFNRQEIVDSLREYNQKCKILKQINSNKSYLCRRNHATLTLVTIVASVLLTSFGFIDKNRIVDLIKPKLILNENLKSEKTAQEITRIVDTREKIKAKLNIVTDFFVLAILTLTIVGLIYRWQERAVEHNNAVKILAALDNDIDDLVNFSQNTDAELFHSYQIIRGRYQSIADFLPPNSDEEFLAARNDYQNKHPQRTLKV